MAEPSAPSALAAELRAPATIRARCGTLAARAEAGDSRHFTLDRTKLPAVADRVAALTRRRFPEGTAIPPHGRWGHFGAGGIDRTAALEQRLAGRTAVAAARSRVELVLVSVLLDAGAGPGWRYVERETGQALARSEGLAVASLHAFEAGLFSSDPGDPCRVDAKALLRIEAPALAAAFQASDAGNALVGLEGRAALLRRLGEALRARPVMFTAEGRPGHLVDVLTQHRHVDQLHGLQLPGLHLPPHAGVTMRHHVPAARLFGLLLEAFSAIWPSGTALADGTPLGDVWPHEAVGLVPFHKLTQWLTYSLIEPLARAGIHLDAAEELTGLPEYRNGGLFLDGGVVVARDAAFAERAYTPADEWVVEWRALTVHLLDELLPLVRERLQRPELSLVQMLEGGTWAAGRELAAERRAGGAPPVKIDSDGTIF